MPWWTGTVMGEVEARQFTEPAIQWLADTVMGEIGARNISWKQQHCGRLAPLWARSDRVTFHGACNPVVGWHGYGRGRGP